MSEQPCEDCAPRIASWVALPDSATEAAEAIGPNGDWSFWLLVPDPDLSDPPRSWPPPHEKTGRLPKAVRLAVWGDALRCGRRTRAGQPCQVAVDQPGEACTHHRSAQPRNRG